MLFLKSGISKLLLLTNYTISIDNIRLVPTDKKIFAGSFAMTPRVSKTEFYKVVKAKLANYRYNLKFSGISASDIDFDLIGKKQQFHIPSVTINDLWMEFYVNYNWPLRTPPKRRDKFPNELLQKLAFDVTIDKMIQKHGDIYFRIVAKKSEKEALLTLNDIHAVNTNITNNTAFKKRNAYSKAVSDCKIMNTGLLHSEMVFNLKDKDAPVTLSSTLAAMDGTAFNPLSEALSLMKIKSGRIEKMQTKINADEYGAKGNIDFFLRI